MVIAFNDPKYAIEPSDFRCARCEREVEVQSPFFSAVFFEGEGFVRRSYCPECWGLPPEASSQAYAFWRSRRPPPQAGPRRVRFDADLVLEFFRRLGPADGAAAAAESAEKTRLRLVLSLLLLRRKYLVYESSAARDGREWLKLSEKAEPSRSHLIENPPLSDEQIEEVKRSLGELLQMDLG